MRIQINTTQVPPTVELGDPDAFDAFSVTVTVEEHLFIGQDELKRLAGGRARDSEWLAKLEGMVSFAASKGWLREDGAIRAHVEIQGG